MTPTDYSVGVFIYRSEFVKLFKMSPTALFLDSPRNRGKNRAKGVPPLQFSHARGKPYKIERSTGSFSADGSLPARSPPLPICTPFRSHARGCVPRHDGRHSLSVLPETWSRLSHSRSRSQAATADCLPSARRRNVSRHAGGIPKGKALWLLLHTSGRAEVCNRREQKELYKLQFTLPRCVFR